MTNKSVIAHQEKSAFAPNLTRSQTSGFRKDSEYSDLLTLTSDKIPDLIIEQFSHKLFGKVAVTLKVDVSKMYDLIMTRKLNFELNLNEGIIYGLLRSGFPINAEALIFENLTNIRNSIKFLVLENVISFHFIPNDTDPIEVFLNPLVQKRAQFQKSTPEYTRDGHDRLGMNLHYSIMDKSLQAKFYLMCLKNVNHYAWLSMPLKKTTQ